MKKEPSDFFEAPIKVKGKPVSKIYGTYLGKLIIDDMLDLLNIFYERI